MTIRTLFSALGLLSISLFADAQVVSFTSTTYPTGNGSAPRRVAFGDITADGNLDLVTFDAGNARMHLFRNNFTGFTFFSNPNSTTNTPLRVFLTDLDFDGDADYIVGYSIPGSPGGGNVQLADAQGNPYGGNFGFSNGGNLSIGDLNNDGFTDIVGEDGTVWQGDGFGGFFAVWTFAIGTQALGSSIADVDQDGNADVMVHDNTFAPGDILYVSLGNGNGSYDAPTISIATNQLDSVQFADVDGDGLPDIIGYSAARGVFEVWLNTYFLNLGFAPVQTYPVPAAPRDLLVGLFSASSFPTVAVLCADGNLRFWINDNFGKLTGPLSVSVGAGASSMAASDFNFDGKDDLAVVNETGNSVTVLKNTTPDAVLVSGTVTYQGRNANAPQIETLLRARNSNGIEIAATSSPDNTFAFLLPRGNWDLRASTSHYLTSKIPLNTTAGDLSGIAFTLRAGDANLDNAVDIADLLILINHYNETIQSGNYNFMADFNGDGANDIGDLLLLISNYNQVGD